MSENKFISRLKGEPTPKSVVEIQNDRLVAPFKSSPMGHIADRDSSVVVAKGAQNWAVNQGQLVPVADDYIGTESDLTATSRVSGAGLWLNATYTFPATSDETNPVSAIIAPSAKWVLTLCGDSLITQNGSVITLTMLVKIGATHLTTKQFKIRECASQFSQRLAIDFSESEQKVIKAHGGSPLTVQVLCDDEGASATIYSGMTHLTLLQRKIDAELVSTDNVLLPEFIENLLEGYIIPADYFSRYDYIEQVEDGGRAMPEFTRNGDDMTFSGWAKPAEEVYTKTEIDNKFTVANAQIDANAVAIAKTRDDYMSADTDIMTIINNHAEELTTLHNDIDELGDDVAEIQAKIPESASGSNPLVTKRQLLDEEMDIRDDLNEGLSELQTQITAQAAEIATKQDKLTAGDNIIISGNVISATGAGGGAGLDMQVVDQLPATGKKGVIYLVAKDGTAPDVYDEYVWIDTTQTFELIGNTQVDLSGYLPLSGGTLTGGLEFRYHATKNGIGFAPNDSISSNALQLGIFANDVFNPYINFGSTGNVFIHPTYDNITDIGSKYNRWRNVFTAKLNNGADLAIPTEGGTLARLEDLENIDALPDQTGNTGKFLMTNGTEASWSDKPLENKSTATTSLSVGGTNVTREHVTVFGIYAGGNAANFSTIVGYGATSRGDYGVAIGSSASVALRANNAIQLGSGTNSDANTFKVGNGNGNFEIMSADGTIPAERYTITPTTAGTYVPKLTIAEDGTATREWGAESGGTGGFNNFATSTSSLVLSASGADISGIAVTDNQKIAILNTASGAGFTKDFLESTSNSASITIGCSTLDQKSGAVSLVPRNGGAKGERSIAIGYGMTTGSSAKGAIQIGSPYGGWSTVTNNDPDTFKVSNTNGNFTIMSADGTIPADRIGNLDFGTMD